MPSLRPRLFLVASLAGCAGAPLTTGGPGGDLPSAPSDAAVLADLGAPPALADLAGGPSVPCGDGACATAQGNACCVSPAQRQSCAALPCGAQDYAYVCDGPEDCGGQAACCFSLDKQGSYCAATCGTAYHLCHAASDCAGGETCSQLEWGPPPLRACYKI